MAPAAVGAASGERGLKSLVWQKLKLSVFDDCRKEEEWKIIILDDFTTKLLSSCGKMTDLLAEGITAVENVYKNREPVPHMKAIYFITPTKKSVDGLINDFVSKSSSKYKAAYVYFTDCLQTCNLKVCPFISFEENPFWLCLFKEFAKHPYIYQSLLKFSF
ncbi:potassium voltage-gated channel subfamily H member 7 [Platysternon megacephalum]|uniref:Potassium voltage-gated channel subfamily H member 7 n=1 Tax=Platysternon megacephalum TaxID=55544 RepID=A0A4D9EV67_9SAUR|nr:potassium voltage-gated channel subfamily H member 7 [Platysternon megacephalum]